MSIIRTTHGATTYVRSRPSDRMTVADVLDFADALRESGIPTDTRVVDQHSHDTYHLTALWARHTVQEPAET